MCKDALIRRGKIKAELWVRNRSNKQTLWVFFFLLLFFSPVQGNEKAVLFLKVDAFFSRSLSLMDQRYQDRDNVHANTHKDKNTMTHKQDKVRKQNTASLPLKNGAEGRTVGSHTHMLTDTCVYREAQTHVLTFTHAHVHTCIMF